MPPQKITAISKTDEPGRLERTIKKRGNGLVKKGHELAIIAPDASVFVAITFRAQGDGQRATAFTFTSRSDRDWKRHLHKLLGAAGHDDAIRLDTAPADYETLFVDPPGDTTDLPKLPRGMKRTFFDTPRSARLVRPQYFGSSYAKSARNLVVVQALAQEHVDAHFGSDVEESTLLLEPLNPEERAEMDAVDYTRQSCPRLPWYAAATIMRRVRAQARRLIRQSRME